MRWQSWILGIVGTLLGSGIVAAFSMSYAGAASAARTEERVEALRKQAEEHEETLRDLVPLLRVQDARSADMVRRLERVEQKIDDAPHARRK